MYLGVTVVIGYRIEHAILETLIVDMVSTGCGERLHRDTRDVHHSPELGLTTHINVTSLLNAESLLGCCTEQS